MAELIKFSAEIKSSDRGGAFVYLPFDVEKTFNKKRVKIVATFDGEPYRGTLVKYGGPEYFLLILKAIREKIGKHPGDIVEVTLKEDTAPRVVEIPKDFEGILNAHPKELQFFNGLSYTQKKEYVQWITGAKKEETRQRRMSKAIEKLKKREKLK